MSAWDDSYEERCKAVECWTCGAKPGEPCRTNGSGKIRFPHAQRQDDASIARSRAMNDEERRAGIIDVLDHYGLMNSEGEDFNPDTADDDGLITALYAVARGQRWEPDAAPTTRAEEPTDG